MQIKVKNISKVYDRGLPTQFNALENVSATIEQGEFIAIIGQTGSGKTTFIEHLNSLIIPEKGEIEYFYKNFNKKTKTVEDTTTIVRKNFFNRVKKAKELRKRVGIVFQFAEYQLFESTIEKDIIFGPVSMGVKKEEAKIKARQCLEMVGLDLSFLEQSPLELSGGQKRRVALAGILAMDPDFLVLDEPTAGLDPNGVKETMKIFERLHKEGKTIIVVTHDLDNVLQWTQRIILFSSGKIIRIGKTYDILEDVEFLHNNNMQPPKIMALNNKLKALGVDLGRVGSIDEMVTKIKDYLATKKSKQKRSK